MAEPTRIVDVMNVMGARPDGWWRDRPGAARRLAEEVAALAERGGGPFLLVLDGPEVLGLPEGDRGGGLAVAYARRGGPDAADDRIVELAEAADDRGSLVVVTSDRALRGRLEALGVAVEGARTLLDRLGQG